MAAGGKEGTRYAHFCLAPTAWSAPIMVYDGAMPRIGGLVAVLIAAGCGDSSGTRPDAGASSDGGAPVDSGAGQVTQDDAVSACIFLGACVGDGVADCFSDILPALGAEAVACVIEAQTDCEAVRACLGILALEVDPDCAPGCDGDRLIDCQDGVRSELDCSTYFELPGQTCILGNFGPECGGGTCDQEGSSCDSDVGLVCDVDRGVLERHDCTRFGWTCVDEAGMARCSDGTEVACADGDAPRCEGASLVRCSGGYELALDCDLVVDGRSCYQVGDSPAFCGFGDECDPLTAKGQETCDGSVITFCAGGAVQSADCAELGFTSCMESIGGGSCRL